MAFQALVPTSPTLTVKQGQRIENSFVCNNAAGSAINMSSFVSLEFKVFVAGGSGIANPLLDDTTSGDFSGSSGAMLYILTAANSATLPPGNYQYSLQGKPTSGDDLQSIASGTIIVQVNG